MDWLDLTLIDKLHASTGKGVLKVTLVESDRTRLYVYVRLRGSWPYFFPPVSWKNFNCTFWV